MLNLLDREYIMSLAEFDKTCSKLDKRLVICLNRILRRFSKLIACLRAPHREVRYFEGGEVREKFLVV